MNVREKHTNIHEHASQHLSLLLSFVRGRSKSQTRNNDTCKPFAIACATVRYTDLHAQPSDTCFDSARFRNHPTTGNLNSLDITGFRSQALGITTTNKRNKRARQFARNHVRNASSALQCFGQRCSDYPHAACNHVHFTHRVNPIFIDIYIYINKIIIYIYIYILIY